MIVLSCSQFSLTSCEIQGLIRDHAANESNGAASLGGVQQEMDQRPQEIEGRFVL